MLVQPSPFLRMPVTMGGSLLDPFLPLNIPDLFYYFDIRTVTGADQSQPLQVDDQSGNLNHAVETDVNKCGFLQTINNLSPKGQHTLFFNGDDPLGPTLRTRYNIFFTSIPPNTNGYTWVTYASPLGPTGPSPGQQEHCVILDSGLTHRPALYYPNWFSNYVYVDSGIANVIAAYTQAPSVARGFELIAWRLIPPSGAGDIQLWQGNVNGLAHIGTLNPWTIDPNVSLAVAQKWGSEANSSSGIWPWRGYMGVTIMYTRALTVAELQMLNLWASVYWGYV
jgi:hypothetical protein